ncbi:MAG UNVERIFIED_CONTAM: hypothetical protein LVR18_17325 [Planctomycetaceae bacterium]
MRNLATNVSNSGERLRLEVLHQTRLLRLRRPSELFARIIQPSDQLSADIANTTELRFAATARPFVALRTAQRN